MSEYFFVLHEGSNNQLVAEYYEHLVRMNIPLRSADKEDAGSVFEFINNSKALLVFYTGGTFQEVEVILEKYYPNISFMKKPVCYVLVEDPKLWESNKDSYKKVSEKCYSNKQDVRKMIEDNPRGLAEEKIVAQYTKIQMMEAYKIPQIYNRISGIRWHLSQWVRDEDWLRPVDIFEELQGINEIRAKVISIPEIGFEGDLERARSYSFSSWDDFDSPLTQEEKDEAIEHYKKVEYLWEKGPYQFDEEMGEQYAKTLLNHSVIDECVTEKMKCYKKLEDLWCSGDFEFNTEVTQCYLRSLLDRADHEKDLEDKRGCYDKIEEIWLHPSYAHSLTLDVFYVESLVNRGKVEEDRTIKMECLNKVVDYKKRAGLVYEIAQPIVNLLNHLVTCKPSLLSDVEYYQYVRDSYDKLADDYDDVALKLGEKKFIYWKGKMKSKLKASSK